MIFLGILTFLEGVLTFLDSLSVFFLKMTFHYGLRKGILLVKHSGSGIVCVQGQL